jgi:hypothetical protein
MCGKTAHGNKERKMCNSKKDPTPNSSRLARKKPKAVLSKRRGNKKTLNSISEAIQVREM